MTRSVFHSSLRGCVLVATALGAAACGGIYGGGGGGGGSIEVRGNIDAVLPDGTGRNIVVFFYREGDEQVDCTQPVLPDVDTRNNHDTMEEGDTEFHVEKIGNGRIVVVFLLDRDGDDADGRIDPGDPVAVLNDPGCVLDQVPNKYIVEIHNVRINFGLDDDAVGFPEPGRAEAQEITEEHD